MYGNRFTCWVLVYVKLATTIVICAILALFLWAGRMWIASILAEAMSG